MKEDILKELGHLLSGDLITGELHRAIYATDASVYREYPLGVVLPKDVDDIQAIVRWAGRNKVGLIPRSAGTSLAGQCVGDGLVVDVSKYMNRILDIDVDKRQVWVEPGVIRDELNRTLEPYGLFFAPNTSTSNRCMIGGMFGNNSCGTTSIEYGTTRDHVLAAEVVFADGSRHLIEKWDEKTFDDLRSKGGYLGEALNFLNSKLSDGAMRQSIVEVFPKASIHRRNQGYALDAVMTSKLLGGEEEGLNLCRLLAGSEGTLAITSKICLNLEPLPLPEVALLCAHFGSLRQSLEATQTAMLHKPSLCELMDKKVLDCTHNSIKYRPMRAFVEGEPEAVLMVEFRGETEQEAYSKAERLIAQLKSSSLGYSFPILFGQNAKGAFELRKAGLGLLANTPGDAKPVACIEDTAVDLSDLPNYIEELDELMRGFGQSPVYYAHAGAGELHVRPILDLKTKRGQADFEQITEETAKLVKKYKGSFSGEHGDGRVRAAYLKLMFGGEVYELFRELKRVFDPFNIMNPGKIIDVKPILEDLRYEADAASQEYDTVFDFGKEGFMRMIERCNGSGDCRRVHTSGALMCPSYMATRDEKDTTRGRANALREFLTHPPKRGNTFAREELEDVMDLCVSCKACTAECPSNVDMAMLKSEWLFQSYKEKRMPLRSKVFSRFYDLHKAPSRFPNLYNRMLSSTEKVIKKTIGVHPKRSLPRMSDRSILKKLQSAKKENIDNADIYLFIDEFLAFHEADIIVKTKQLLEKIGLKAQIISNRESGRAAISKGDLRFAQRLANNNVEFFYEKLKEGKAYLVGCEPSAILTFCDEYPKLVNTKNLEKAKYVASRTLFIDEYLAKNIDRLELNDDVIKGESVLLHGHCHQKALSNVAYSAEILERIGGYQVTVIPSSCCGMAGSFGYEKEHYKVSMQMGELVLFPTIRRDDGRSIICAPGTSCRHQIADGTGTKAHHTIELLHRKLINS